MSAIDLSIKGNNNSASVGQFNYWGSNVSQSSQYYNYDADKPIDLSLSKRHLDSNKTNKIIVNSDKQQNLLSESNFTNQNNFPTFQGGHYQSQNLKLMQINFNQNQSNILALGKAQNIPQVSEPAQWTRKTNQGPNHFSQQHVPYNDFYAFMNNYSSSFQGPHYGSTLSISYDWTQQSQENGLAKNIVKNEVNNSFSNDETSDLGNSVNTTGDSEESFSFDNNDIKQDSSLKSKTLEKIEKWISDDNTLPKGWKKKTASTGHGKFRLLFLSPKGLKFSNRIAVEDHLMENSNIYSKADIEKFRTNYKANHRQKYEWVSDEITLPKGWKKRTRNAGGGNFKTLFLTNKKEKFTNRMAVLGHMEENSHIYTETDIEKFKLNYMTSRCYVGPKSREYTKWDNSDPSLPAGWFKRQSDYIAKDGKRVIEYQYLSPDQQTFNSRNTVVAFMKTSTFYSQADIEMVLSGRIIGGRGRGRNPKT